MGKYSFIFKTVFFLYLQFTFDVDLEVRSMRHETKNVYSPVKIPKNPPTQKYERNNGLLTHNSMTGTIFFKFDVPSHMITGHA